MTEESLGRAFAQKVVGSLATKDASANVKAAIIREAYRRGLTIRRKQNRE